MKEKQIEDTKKKKLNNKKFKTISLLVFAIALLLASFSFAFFTRRDEVKNRLSANDYEIKLYEQDWVDGGITDAEKMEPGMVIKKDPNTFNASTDDVYVRMKIVVADKTGDITDTEKGKKILSALYLDNGNSLFELTAAPEGENVLGELKKVDGTNQYISCNENFYYAADGWFYCINPGSTVADSSDAASVLKLLNPEDYTAKLFNEIKVPILKDEYYYNFNEKFHIYIVAQGLPVEKYVAEDGTVQITGMTFSTVMEKFDKAYSKYSFEK